MYYFTFYYIFNKISVLVIEISTKTEKAVFTSDIGHFNQNLVFSRIHLINVQSASPQWVICLVSINFCADIFRIFNIHFYRGNSICIYLCIRLICFAKLCNKIVKSRLGILRIFITDTEKIIIRNTFRP